MDRVEVRGLQHDADRVLARVKAGERFEVTAVRLGPQLDAVVAYDHRLADAVRSAGLAALAPGHGEG